MFKNSNYFLTIAEEGNLSRAAEKLYVTQPALSKYLRRLETALQTELFDHHSSPLKLTAAGEHYLNYVHRINALEKQFLGELSELRTEYHDKIRFGLTSFRGTCILPKILPEFQTRYPYVNLEIVEEKSESLLSDLQKGSIDLCLTFPIDLVDYSEFTYYTIANEKILLAGNRNNALVKKLLEQNHLSSDSEYPHAELNLFQNETFVLSTTGQMMTSLVNNMFTKYNFHPKKVLQLSNAITNVSLVASSDCFTLVPEAIIASGSAPKNIAYFTVDAPPLQWPVAVFFRKSTYINAPLRSLVDLMQDFFRSPSMNSF